MASHTIYLFDRTAVSVTNLSGAAPRNGDVIQNALNGNAFSWEVPDNLKLTFPTSTVGVTFEDKDGILSDDPYSGDRVADQYLTEPVSIGGQTHTPNQSEFRWLWGNEPVTVENEYEVTLFDAAGNEFRMVGVSITKGYVTNVVGVMFDGPAPGPGVTLYYIQGKSQYFDHQSNTIPDGVACFLAGTLIETPRGPRRIEDLQVGDRVLTLDNGAMPIRWIGRSQVDGTGALAPILIPAGALGNRRDLWLSPNHRVFLRAARAELYFGSNEVLIAARHLVDGQTIRQVPVAVADYLHIALDSHQMIYSEGIATESFFTGENALATLDPEARAELEAIFPGVAAEMSELGRRGLTGREARLIQSIWRPTAPIMAPQIAAE